MKNITDDKKHQMESFFEALGELEEKGKEFRKKRHDENYKTPYKAITQLHVYLSRAGEQFRKGEITTEVFTKKCDSLIDSVEPTLKQHRGFGKIFAAITSVINFFKGSSKVQAPKTDTAQKIDKMRAALSDIKKTEESESSQIKPGNH